MNKIIKITSILLILVAVMSLSGCIGEDVPAEDESDVVIVDESVDVVIDESVADEFKDVDEVFSKPSSSSNLVAGVDGTPGHVDEIKAKRDAAEAARLAMLNALADSLPEAINASENASFEAFAAEEIYNGACVLMNATIETNATLVEANATTIRTLENKTLAIELFNARDADKNNATDELRDYNATEQAENSTAIFDALNATLVQATEYLNEAETARDYAIIAYNHAVDVEISAQEAYDSAVSARGSLTQEVVDELRVTVTEARTSADEALAYLEECQAAYDELNQVEEPVE